MIFWEDLNIIHGKYKYNGVHIWGLLLLFTIASSVPALAAQNVQAVESLPARGLFADLPPRHWAYSALSELIAAGLVPPNFKPAGQFDGMKPATRYEAAFYLYGLAGLLEGQAASPPARSKFADPVSVRKVAALFEEFKGELAALGIRFAEVEEKLAALGQEEPWIGISGDLRLAAESWGGLLSENQGEEPEAPLPEGPVYGTVPEVSHQLALRFDARVGQEAIVSIALKNKKRWGVPDVDSRENSNLLFTDEASVRLSTSRGLLTLGRHRFKLGPLGILAANPFDAFEGAQFESTLGKTLISIVYNRQNADYVYAGRPYNYIYSSDEYLAARWAAPGKNGWYGLNLLLSGLSDQMGASADFKGLLWGKTAVMEIAGFKASSTDDYAFPGWVGAGLLSIDLLQGKDYLLNINVGSLSSDFTPMASNLGQANGEIDLPRGSTGLQVNYSRLINPTQVFDVETTIARAAVNPWEGNILLKTTKAIRQNTELEVSYRHWFFAGTNRATTSLSLDYRF